MNNTATNSRDVGEQIYAAFAAGAVDDLLARFRDDVVLDVPGDHPNAGRWEGRSGFVDFLAASSAVATEDVEVVDLLAGDRHVAGYVVVRGERAGRTPLVNHSVHLFELDDEGLVTSIRFHNADQPAVDAFWR